MTRAAAGASAPIETPERIGNLTGRDVADVLGELSDLLDAGCPLSRALAVMRRQAKRKNVRALLGRLEADIVNGASLAEAVAAVGGRFTPMHVAMIRAAETGGFLQKTLAHMAAFGARRMELIGRITSAMTYPGVLLLTALGSIVFLLTFVVPRFSRVYENAGALLPWPTRVLMSVSDAAAQGWWLLLAAVAPVAALVRLLSRHEPTRLRIDGLLLRAPVAGWLLHRWALGEFTRCMALLLDGGVSVLNSLTLSAGVIGNRAVRTRVRALADGVRQGEPMGRQMADDPLFPPSTTELISIAEESGNLPRVMSRLSGQFTQRLEARLSVLMSLVEPTIVLVVGALVALIVAAMLLPVLLMNTLIE